MDILSAHAIHSFWKWFVANEQRVFDSSVTDTPVHMELTEHLRSIHDVLTWELGPTKDGTRDFVISADGVREGYFPVEEVAIAAPHLRLFRVVRFRPRVPDFEKHTLTFKDHRLTSADIEFSVEPDDGMIGLVLFVRGCNANTKASITEACFLMLDMALGEHDMLTRIGFVEILPFQDHPNAPRLSFGRIRAVCDAIGQRMNEGK